MGKSEGNGEIYYLVHWFASKSVKIVSYLLNQSKIILYQEVLTSLLKGWKLN